MLPCKYRNRPCNTVQAPFARAPSACASSSTPGANPPPVPSPRRWPLRWVMPPARLTRRPLRTHHGRRANSPPPRAMSFATATEAGQYCSKDDQHKSPHDASPGGSSSRPAQRRRRRSVSDRKCRLEVAQSAGWRGRTAAQIGAAPGFPEVGHCGGVARAPRVRLLTYQSS